MALDIWTAGRGPETSGTHGPRAGAAEAGRARAKLGRWRSKAASATGIDDRPIVVNLRTAGRGSEASGPPGPRAGAAGAGRARAKLGSQSQSQSPTSEIEDAPNAQRVIPPGKRVLTQAREPLRCC